MTPNKAGNPAFWKLASPDTTRGLASASSEYEPTITCPLDSGHQRPGRRIGYRYVELTSTWMADFVWTWLGPPLLPERTLALFRAAGLTGFDVRPVTTRWKVRTMQPGPEDLTLDSNPGVAERVAAQTPVPRLWEVVVTGWGGMIPPEFGMRLVRSCPACGLKRYVSFMDLERLIDERQWDGSDFFKVWPVGYTFVTDRVAQLMQEHGLRGVQLRPLSWQRPEEIPCSAPSLSEYLPVARAREVSARLRQSDDEHIREFVRLYDDTD